MDKKEIALKVLAGEKPVRCPNCKGLVGYGPGEYNCCIEFEVSEGYTYIIVQQRMTAAMMKNIYGKWV